MLLWIVLNSRSQLKAKLSVSQLTSYWGKAGANRSWSQLPGDTISGDTICPLGRKQPHGWLKGPPNGPEKTAPRLRALAALVQDMGSILSTKMKITSVSTVPKVPLALSGNRNTCGVQTYMQANIHTHYINKQLVLPQLVVDVLVVPATSTLCMDA